MACTRNRSEAIADLAAGRLAADSADELLQHVTGCAPCSAEFDLVADLVAGAERSGQEFFGVESGAPPPSLLTRLRPLAAAAAVLATAVLWFALSGRGPVDLAELATLDPLPAQPGALRSTETRAGMDAALERYAAGEWAEAAAEFGEVLDASATPSADALPALYLGIARLQLGDSTAAADALERAAETGAGLLRERALWYLGNAHLVAGDAAAAAAVFEELAALAGDYELNAREKLEQLR